MDRKNAKVLFQGNVHQLDHNQRQKCPRCGVGTFVQDGRVHCRANVSCCWSEPIIETSPRVLTGYVADAKAGDVYQCPGTQSLWKLEARRKPREGDQFISYSYGTSGWDKVCVFETAKYIGAAVLWIVVPHSPPVERESVFIGDVLGDADAINPPHYKQLDIETIDLLERCATPIEFRGFLRLTAIAYRLRAGHKGQAATDIEKAKWYETKLKEIDQCPTT